MGKETVDIDYEILGNAPDIILKGEAVRNPEKFIEDSILKQGKAMARHSIGEVPTIMPFDLKNDETIAEAIADVKIDDPYFKDLDPITGQLEIGEVAVAKTEAAKESVTNPKDKTKLTDFERNIAKKVSRAIYTGTNIGLTLSMVACGIKTAVPTVSPDVSPQAPATTEVTPPPTTEPTKEPTKEPTPEVFKNLEGATATPSANGKSWNIKLENGQSFEVADPERDIKIDAFGVWNIFDKDSLLIYVYDPGIKQADGTFIEGKGWIDATDLSPVDSSTFPKAYSEIVNDPMSSTETEQNDYQKFLDAVTFKFANEQGIQEIIDQLRSSDKIDQQLLSLWVRMYIQNNPDSLKNPESIRGKDIVLGPTEIRTARLLEDAGAFNAWTENVKDDNGRYARIRYGWDYVFPISSNPDYQKINILGVEVPIKNEEGDSISGVLLGIARVDNDSNGIILMIAMKTSAGKFILALRSANLGSNFTVPQGAACKDNYGIPIPAPENLRANLLTEGGHGKLVTHDSLLASLGSSIENLMAGFPGNMKCYYPYGLNMSSRINITKLYYSPSTPWYNIPSAK